MAEALCKHIIQKAPSLSGDWRVASAGCWAYPGMPATSKAIPAVAELGAALEDHASQAITEDLLKSFNLILCMEQGHVDFIKRHFPDSEERVFLLSEMIGEKFEIYDPIGQSEDAYLKTARQILSILEEGWEKISSLSISQQT